MTEAEHADLSRRLALAMEWPEHLLHSAAEPVYGWRVWAWCEADPGCTPKNRPPYWPWRPFDYRDEQIIWRVAEHFDCFPWKNGGTEWCVLTEMKVYYGDTAAEAVARAVIGARG